MIVSSDGLIIMFSNAVAPRRNRHNVLLLAWLTSFVLLTGKIICLPYTDFYPFPEIVNTTEELDDGGSEKLYLDTEFPFFNSTYSFLYVNNNGIISFDEKLKTYKPLNFNKTSFEKTAPPLVAPYWADVDIQYVTGQNETIEYSLTKEPYILDLVNRDVRSNFIGQRQYSSKLVLIVTWYQVGFYGAVGEGQNKRNTFQAVLATDGNASFAIFNYNQTVWTTGSNSDGATDTGLGGKPAVVGFYSGSDGRFYLLDYSGSDEIKNIVHRSNVGIPGKYMFRLDGDINDLSCSAKELLSISPSSVSMLGREVIVVSGPCFTDLYSVRGRIRELDLEFDCLVIDEIAECVIPSLFRTGVLNFELDPYGEGWNYSTALNSVHLLNVPTKLIRNKIDNWLAGRTVSVSWSNESAPEDVEKTFSVLGYMVEDGKPSFKTLANYTVQPRELFKKFKLMSDFKGHSTLVTSLCWQENFDMLSRCIWSDVFPARWKDRNSKKSETWCTSWINKEKDEERIKIPPQNCPCVVKTAQNDGQFSTDPNCDNTSVSTNCIYNKNAHKCFRRKKGATNSGETCCYDEKGFLMDIRSASGAGTQQRYHSNAQGDGIVSYFSYFESDLLPKLHCCQYSDKNCTDFIIYRSATMCQNYTAPSLAQACGDPHLVTLDGKEYSFNGIGNYYLVTDTSSSVEIQVHAEQARDDKGDLQNATVFTQVAMAMPGLSDTLEIRKTEAGYDVLVNNVIIPTTTTTSHFKNISLYHQDDGSLRVVLDPVSVSFTVEVTPDLLNIIVFIGEESLKGKIRGLLGNYNGDPEDDFISRNETILPDSVNMRQIHYDFGLTWLVPENESILSSLPVELSSELSFQPVFMDEESKLSLPNDSYEVCGENVQCLFDYGVTQKRSIAESTAQFVSKFVDIKHQLAEKAVRCEYLYQPENGNVNTTGYSEGDTATFTCDPGYELTHGTYIRQCQEDSLWSGSDVTCAIKVIQEDKVPVEIIVVAVASSAGTLLLVIVCAVCCYIKRRQRKNPTNRPDPEPMSTIRNIPIFENPVFMKMLHDTTSEGRFRIPRPNYVDPSIFQEYF